MTRWQDRNSVDKCNHLASYQRSVLSANCFVNESSSYRCRTGRRTASIGTAIRKTNIWFVDHSRCM